MTGAIASCLRRLALFLLLACCATAATDQFVLARVLSDSEVEQRFAIDASDHRMYAARVASSRGPSAERTVRGWNSGAPANVRLVRAALRTNGFAAQTGVLFYSVQEDRLRVYLLSADQPPIGVESDVGRDELADASLNLQLSLGVDGIAAARTPHLRDLPRFEGSGRREFEADLTRLSDLVLPPELRRFITRMDHLVIVADGTIASLPFAALSMGNGALLVDHATVSIAPGLYDLSRPVNPWDGARVFADTLIVGDPAVPDNTRWNVPRLPGAEQEARELSERLGIEPLLGAAATKQLVAQQAANASVIYIAAHGISDPDNPLAGGFLMLAGDDATSAFWTAAEIQEQQFHAQLTVLSACQTGLGRNMDGGVVGLSRAFHLAGVPRVVMSLWSVDDIATSFLMQRFTTYAMTEHPAVALRLAMLDAREINDDPALWASFAVFGTAR